jgi:hypothetical protein
MCNENQPELLSFPECGFSPPVPFPDSYWILPNRFLAGEYPGSPDEKKTLYKLESLALAGIRHIVDLTEAGESRYSPTPLRRYDHLLSQISPIVTWTRFPIPDRGTIPKESIKALLDHIDLHLARGVPVYVHCWGGHGRTGLVAGCWLARKGYGVGGEVISLRARLRRNMPDGWKPSPEMAAQKEIVRSWEKGQ